MRRCYRRPLTNRLLLAAHNWGRCAAWCPCVRLLYMTNGGWFCWRGFGLRLIVGFRRIRLFADRRRFFRQQIIRKTDFRLLRMKMIPRRRFLCAGFLCSLGIGATASLLWRWYRFALWPLRFWSGAYILRALTRCIFCRWHGHCGMLRLLRRDRRRWRGRFCGLLNISTSGLFLRCGYRFALRRCRIWPGTRCVCSFSRRFRRMARLVGLLRLHTRRRIR